MMRVKFHGGVNSIAHAHHCVSPLHHLSELREITVNLWRYGSVEQDLQVACAVGGAGFARTT